MKIDEALNKLNGEVSPELYNFFEEKLRAAEDLRRWSSAACGSCYTPPVGGQMFVNHLPDYLVEIGEQIIEAYERAGAGNDY